MSLLVFALFLSVFKIARQVEHQQLEHVWNFPRRNHLEASEFRTKVYEPVMPKFMPR